METTSRLPMVRGGRKARSISAGRCIGAVRVCRTKESLYARFEVIIIASRAASARP
ncbi:hypothetical protein ACIGXF_13480 [Streptomyces sp. NPDC053086]|uniref:hypothetical protein n=1 Tax=unclassified Streptomyces TaxID=2593676 RepID=UPI0037D0FC7E